MTTLLFSEAQNQVWTKGKRESNRYLVVIKKKKKERQYIKIKNQLQKITKPVEKYLFCEETDKVNYIVEKDAQSDISCSNSNISLKLSSNHFGNI